MREASNLEIAALCFAHRYQRVGWDLTRSMSDPAELSEDFASPPDRDYPGKLWGESVVHSFKTLRLLVSIPAEDVDALAAWQLAEPDRDPIRLLAPESLAVFKKVYPEAAESTLELRSLQTRPPAAPAEPAQAPELFQYVQRHGSMLWRAQQAFAILFFNFLLHHDVVRFEDMRIP